MNVLLVINKLGLGGAEQFVMHLAAELTRRGHGVSVVSDDGPLASRLDPAVRWTRCTHAHDRSPGGILRLARALVEVMRASRVDLVHANSPTTALAARLACASRRMPVVASAHGVWRDRAKPAVSLILGLASDRVVSCSEAIRADLLRWGLPPGRASTIHNGVPCPEQPADPEVRHAVRAEFGLAPGAGMILTAARLADNKGLSFLLAALAKVPEAVPGTKLLIAGDGERRADLEASARALGLAGSVRFLGRRDDLPRLMAGADVFCLPSLAEGLPLAIAEAMAASLPVVATAVGGVPEIVVDGATGFLVPPGDSDALSAALIRVLSEPGLGTRLGSAGRERARRHFSLERMATRFEALYERQIGEN